jgi:transposase-like protein
MTKITEKQQYWLSHFQAAEASGTSLAGYARQHELNPKLFHSWVHQLRKRDLIPAAKPRRSSGSFARVESTEQAATSLPADIVLPNGVRLRVPAVNRALLSDLLALQVAP